MSGPVRPPLTVETVDGATVGRPITTLKVSNGTLTVSGSTATVATGGSGGSGTVTSVNPKADSGTGTAITTAGSFDLTGGTGITTSINSSNEITITATNNGTVTSIATTAPLTGGTITGSGTIGIPEADSTTDGYLSSADWTTFNNKGSGTVTGTGAATEVAVWSGTSAVGGSNGLLFDGTSLTVNTLGASDPIVNLASSSKSLTFQVETSQQLSVKGSADKFVFDASSATGGITWPDGTSQITANNAVGTITSVSGTAPVVSSGGTTPAISMAAATTSVDGYLTSTNFTTFNDKQAAITLTTTGTSGAATLVGATLNIPQYSGGATSPGGSNTQVQFNDNGSFGGNNKMQYVASSGVLTLTNYAQFNNVVIGFNSGVITTSSAANLKLQPFYGITSGIIEIGSGANTNITLTPDGTGEVHLRNYKFDVDQTVGATEDNYVLTYNDTTGLISLEAAGGGGGISWSTPVDSTITPDTTATYDLGTSTVLFRKAYFSSDVTTGSINMSGNLTRPNGSLQITAGGSQSSRANIFLPNNETNMKILGSSSSKTDIILDTRWTDASNTATIQLKTKGQTRFQVGADGELYINTDEGTSGQVLTSGGAGAAPTWAAAGGGSGTVTVGTNAGNNNLAYFSGATEISNTNNISINAVAGSADFFGQIESSKFVVASGGGGVANTDGTAALPSYSFSSDPDTGFWRPQSDQLSMSLGGTRLFDFQKSGTSGKLDFRGSAPIIECDDASADLSLRSGGSTYGEILISNENSNIEIKPAGSGLVKVSDAYTLPGIVAATDGFVLSCQTDGSTLWDHPHAIPGTPSSSSDTGKAGSIQYDSSYFYICVAANTWRRVAISSW